MTVALVGGGVVGLTGAIALREAGLEVTVFDRVEDVAAAQIGAGLGLAFNATRVLRRLGLLDGLARSDPASSDSSSGLERKLLSTWGVPEASTSSASPASRSTSCSSTHCLPTRSFAARRVGYEQDDSSATALFDDGIPVQSDVLVGADGLRSTIRAQGLGDEQPRYADFSVTRCLVPAAGDDPLPRGVFRMLWGGGACIGMYHVAPGSVYVFGWWPERGGLPRRARRAQGWAARALRRCHRRFPS